MTGGWNAARGPADQRDTNDDSTRWDLRAACALNDLFLVDTSRLDDNEKAETRRICRTCPVRLECLTDALEKENAGVKVWGIRGGRTHAQRTGETDRAHIQPAVWTPEEDALVLASQPVTGHHGREAARALAEQLGRTVVAVRTRRRRLTNGAAS